MKGMFGRKLIEVVGGMLGVLFMVPSVSAGNYGVREHFAQCIQRIGICESGLVQTGRHEGSFRPGEGT
jgi:hypothetical protein